MTDQNTDLKVFCLGFQKTGTNSLQQALEVLGVKPVGGYDQFRDIAHNHDLTWEQVEERALAEAKNFAAFQDMPWPLFYKKFDEIYPNAKFILMIRETESWVNSCVNDFGTTQNVLRRLIYNVPHPVGHEDRYREIYDGHNAAVQEHFADRPGKLLVVKTGEAAWDKLCDFLDMPVPEVSWPRANTREQKQRMMRRQRIKAKLLGLVGLGSRA